MKVTPFRLNMNSQPTLDKRKNRWRLRFGFCTQMTSKFSSVFLKMNLHFLQSLLTSLRCPRGRILRCELWLSQDPLWQLKRRTPVTLAGILRCGSGRVVAPGREYRTGGTAGMRLHSKESVRSISAHSLMLIQAWVIYNPCGTTVHLKYSEWLFIHQPLYCVCVKIQVSVTLKAALDFVLIFMATASYSDEHTSPRLQVHTHTLFYHYA